MQTGKSKSLQKTRQPYGKVTEVGQVPVALHEIKDLASSPSRAPFLDQRERLETIDGIVASIISVTCASPGCLSEMAAQSAHVQQAT